MFLGDCSKKYFNFLPPPPLFYIMLLTIVKI